MLMSRDEYLSGVLVVSAVWLVGMLGHEKRHGFKSALSLAGATSAGRPSSNAAALPTCHFSLDPFLNKGTPKSKILESSG